MVERGDVLGHFDFFRLPELSEEERRPPEFIVAGMVPCGLSFLSGAPKIRKSFFALQLAAAVATGNEFLGCQTIRSDVVYLDLEGSKSRAAFRAGKMFETFPRNVLISNRTAHKLSDGLVDDLRELHQRCPAVRLIIIDTYSRARVVCKSTGANAYDLDVAFLEPLQRMAISENIAVLCVHHDKKGAGFTSDSFERISGTMGISGSADAVLNLIAEGKRFEGRATLEYTPRDAKGGEVKLLFDDAAGLWREEVSLPVDVRGNPVCAWLIEHCPERGCVGEFYPYGRLFRATYGCDSEKCGELVRQEIAERRTELFEQYGVGVQLGVKSHGERGVRIFNLL